MGTLKIAKKGITLSEQAYEIIKDAIIKNQFKSGEILAEQPLAEKLNISRTPIKAALNRLVYENIAEVNATNNIVVSNITEDEVKDITDIRKLLECFSVKLLENKMTKEKLKELKTLIIQHEKAINKGNIEDVLECDFCFHIKLAEFTDNKFLFSTVEAANTNIKRFLILSGTLEKYCTLAIDEHKTVYEALEKENYEEAAHALELHLINVNKRMLKR
jgi:DNA-binding GntR family transcriptional regulator